MKGTTNSVFIFPPQGNVLCKIICTLDNSSPSQSAPPVKV